MSMKERVAVNCPECQWEQDVFIWNSLNAQVSPEARTDFLAGGINTFKCSSCGVQTAIAAPFMYHDMALKFCVQYYPVEFLDDEETYRNLNQDGVVRMDTSDEDSDEEDVNFSEEMQYMLHPHIVFDMQEAIYYVVFRERLAAFHQKR